MVSGSVSINASISRYFSSIETLDFDEPIE